MTQSPPEKPVRWLHGEIKTPLFSFEGRLEAGGYLGALQQGLDVTFPASRPMPQIGVRCHELRIKEPNKEWRIIYRTDPDCVLVLEVFLKKPAKTPQIVIENCQKRLKAYDKKQGR